MVSVESSCYRDNKELPQWSRNLLFELRLTSMATGSTVGRHKPVIDLLNRMGAKYNPDSGPQQEDTLAVLLTSWYVNHIDGYHTNVTVGNATSAMGISRDLVTRLLTVLSKAGEIEVIKGYLWRLDDGDIRRVPTRVRFLKGSTLFATLQQGVADGRLHMANTRRFYHVVQKRLRASNSTEYSRVLVTGDARPVQSVNLYKAYAYTMDHSCLTLPKDAVVPGVAGLVESMPTIQLSTTAEYLLNDLATLHCVANNDMLTLGCRHYMYLSNFSKSVRNRLRIDDENTSEVDISSCQIAQIHAMAGAVVPDAPYEHPTIPLAVQKEMVLGSFNCTSKRQFISFILDRIKANGLEVSYREWVDYVTAKLPHVAACFGTGLGLRLQHDEAQAMELAMLDFMARVNRLCLLIHDCLIVPEFYEDFAARSILAGLYRVYSEKGCSDEAIAANFKVKVTLPTGEVSRRSILDYPGIADGSYQLTQYSDVDEMPDPFFYADEKAPENALSLSTITVSKDRAVRPNPEAALNYKYDPSVEPSVRVKPAKSVSEVPDVEMPPLAMLEFAEAFQTWLQHAIVRTGDEKHRLTTKDLYTSFIRSGGKCRPNEFNAMLRKAGHAISAHNGSSAIRYFNWAIVVQAPQESTHVEVQDKAEVRNGDSEVGVVGRGCDRRGGVHAHAGRRSVRLDGRRARRPEGVWFNAGPPEVSDRANQHRGRKDPRTHAKGNALAGD